MTWIYDAKQISLFHNLSGRTRLKYDYDNVTTTKVLFVGSFLPCNHVIVFIPILAEIFWWLLFEVMRKLQKLNYKIGCTPTYLVTIICLLCSCTVVTTAITITSQVSSFFSWLYLCIYLYSWRWITFGNNRFQCLTNKHAKEGRWVELSKSPEFNFLVVSVVRCTYMICDECNRNHNDFLLTK